MNGTFNSRMFAGAAGAALVFVASTGFAATATITPTPIQITAASTSYVGTATQSVIPLLSHGAVGTWQPDPDWFAKPITNRGAVGNWTAETQLVSIVYSVVDGDAEFNIYASFSAIAASKIADADFVSTTSLVIDCNRIQQPTSSWSGSGAWDAPISVVTRYFTGSWNAGNSFFNFEPTQYVLLDTTTYHTGVTYWDGKGDWDVDTLKTAIFVGDAVWQEATQVDFVPTLIQKSVDEWLPTADNYFYASKTIHESCDYAAEGSIYAFANKTQYSEPSTWINASFINISAVRIQNVALSFGSVTNDWAASAYGRFSGQTVFDPLINLTVTGTHTHKPQTGFFSNTNSIFVDPAQVKINYTLRAEGTWVPAASWEIDPALTRHNYTYQGIVNFVGNAAASVDDAKLRYSFFYKVDADWENNSSISENTTKTFFYFFHKANAEWTADAVVTPSLQLVTRTRLAESLEWFGAASQLSVASQLSAFGPYGNFLFAPDRRKITVTYEERGLRIPYDERQFYILTSSNSNEV